MKKIYLLIFTALIGITGFSQKLYTWNGGSGNYSDATKWTPGGRIPDPADTLVFNNNGNDTLNNIPDQETIGALWVKGGAKLVLQSSANWNTLHIQGGISWDNDGFLKVDTADIFVDPTSSLTIAGKKPLIIDLANAKDHNATDNNVAVIKGTFELKDTAHKILVLTSATTAKPNNQEGLSYMLFRPGSYFNMNYSTAIDSICLPFVKYNSALSTSGLFWQDGDGDLIHFIYFDSAATFNHLSGVGPYNSFVNYAFNDPTTSYVSMNTHSQYFLKTDFSKLGDRASFYGKYYGSVIIDNPAIDVAFSMGGNSNTPSGSFPTYIFDSLIVKNGAFGFRTTYSSKNHAPVYIGGDMHIYSGGYLGIGQDTTTTTKNDSVYCFSSNIINEGILVCAASSSSSTFFDINNDLHLVLKQPMYLVNENPMNPTAHFIVEPGITLGFDSTTSAADSAIVGNGSFDLLGGAMLKIASKDGITQSPVAKGNIQTDTRNFDATATYIYNRNKTGTQSTGDGLPNPLLGELIVNLGSNANQPLTLSAPVSIGDGSNGGTLTLTRGNLQTDGTNLLTINSDATLNGGSVTSYISGPMKKIGNTDFVFPIGKGGIFGKVGLVSMAAIPPTQEFTAEYFHSAYSDVANANVNAPLNHVSHKEYWTITANTNVTNGTLNAGNTKVQLFSNSSTVSQITDLTTLRVAHYNGTKWDNAGNTATTGSLPGVVSVTSNSINTFSPFTFATTSNMTNPLPLTLISFNGTVNGVNSLYWVSARELNVARFDIERSLNGVDFINIGTVKAVGTTDFNKYNFNDTKTPEGVSYYRLRIFDKDGTSKLSGIIALNNKKNNNQIITVFPNPVKDVAFITLQASSSSYSIELNQMNGQRVKSKQVDVTGIANTSMDLTDVPAGTYMMVLRDKDGIKAIQRVVKQ